MKLNVLTPKQNKNCWGGTLWREIFLGWTFNSEKHTPVLYRLFVYNLYKCLFLVWTPHRQHKQFVHRNNEFIYASLPTLSCFFKKHSISELITKKLENAKEIEHVTQPVENGTIYCICKSRYNDNERWIGCDSESC